MRDQYPMEQLSENRIKKVALQFLKNYYKFRPREGETELKLDQTGEGNIIADGHLSFLTDENKKFLATFEATSVASKEEVLYENRFKLLIWDSIMWGAILAALIFMVLYAENFMTLRLYDLGVNLAVVIGLFLFIGSVYYIIFQYRSKYHYIYAIEQFKQYFADDQWIALADDVFQDYKDPYYEELKDQCIDNGFGLFTVDNKFHPTLIIAPARQDEVKNKRQALAFDNKQYTIRDRTMMTVRSGWQKLASLFKKSTSGISLDRFKSKVMNQIFWTMMSATLVAFIFAKQFLDTEHRYINNEELLKELEGIGDVREPHEIIDSIALIFMKPFGQADADYLDLNPYDDHPPVDPYIGDIESFIASDSRLFTYYDCERLYNLNEHKFLIKYESFHEFDNARNRVVNLAQKGIRTSLVWHGCFRGPASGYILFLGLMQNSEESAHEEGKRLLKKIRAANEPYHDMKIMSVREL